MDKIRNFFARVWESFLKKVAITAVRIRRGSKLSSTELLETRKWRPAFLIEWPAECRGLAMPRLAAFWGLSYSRFNSPTAILLPIPFNLIFAITRNLYFRARHGINPSWIEKGYRGKYPDYNRGYNDGFLRGIVYRGKTTDLPYQQRPRLAWLVQRPDGSHAIQMRYGRDQQELSHLLQVDFLGQEELKAALAKVESVFVIPQIKA